MKIKILKDTPFHKAGSLLPEKTFRDIYPAFKSANLEKGSKVFTDKTLNSYKEENIETTFNYSEWFELVDELMFGNCPVEILKVYTHQNEIEIKCKGHYFKYLDILDWYNHFVHVMMGFHDNTNSVQFQGFSCKRHMLPEKNFIGFEIFHKSTKPSMDACGHLTNTGENNQKMDDVLNFPLNIQEVDNIEIKIGCTTGKLSQLITILNECKKLSNEK